MFFQNQPILENLSELLLRSFSDPRYRCITFSSFPLSISFDLEIRPLQPPVRANTRCRPIIWTEKESSIDVPALS